MNSVLWKGYKMLNKDKRSLILSMVLGDGCISYGGGYKNGKYSSGKLSMKHGHKQKDYLEWKTKFLEIGLNVKINIKPCLSHVKLLNKTYNQYQMSWTYKRMKAWKKILYQNSIKNIPKILKFIKHYNFAAAIWLMDDGSCTRNTKKNGTEVFTGLTLYVCDQPRDYCYEIISWWKLHFKVNPKLKWQKQYYKGIIKEYPKIYFNNLDSLKIWKEIRPFVMEIPSMKNKFRFIEARYNRSDLLQP